MPFFLSSDTLCGMRHEKSFGIIPLRQEKDNWQVLLVQHGKKHWAFPKGHADPGELPRAAATRELFEETGLQVAEWLSLEPICENYHFKWSGVTIAKEVVYFVAKVTGDVCIQVEEISDYKWLSFEEAQKLATFPETKKLCKKVQDLIL